MYYFFALLLGFFVKFFDDTIDLKLNIPKFYIEFSKSMIIFLSILLIQNDVILGVIILFSLIISNYCKKFDDDFWYSYLYIIFLLCVYLKNDIMSVLLNSKKYYTILYILYLPLTIYFEETTFPEEKSKHKFKIRMYNIVCNSIVLCLLKYYNLEMDIFVKILIFINSYFLTNIIIQYILFTQTKTNTNESINILC